MKSTLTALLLFGALRAYSQTSPATSTPSNTAEVSTPAAYGTAKTTGALLNPNKRLLILDDGVKRKLRTMYYEDEKRRPVTFDSEGAVLNFLDAQGWTVTPNGQETSAGGSVYRLYMLKRKQPATTN